MAICWVVGVESGANWKSAGRFDFHYITDSLWNIESPQKARLASWNRGRGTVDIDFGELAGWNGLSFHATALCREAAILDLSWSRDKPEWDVERELLSP